MGDSRQAKVLALKVVALVFLAVVSYAAIWWVCMVTFIRQDLYLAAAIDKEKLLKNTPSPKMVLVGGSNLAFGLDSARLHAAFKMPVVNMGLHGGVGLKFMLDQVAPYLGEGDILVMVPEYQHFVGDSFFGGEPLIEVAAVTRRWSHLVGMPPLNLTKAALNGNSIFDKPITVLMEKLHLTQANQARPGALRYSRSGFNGYGDEVAHLVLPNKKLYGGVVLTNDINQNALKYIKAYNAARSTAGVTILMVYPCLEQSYYQRNAEAIAAIAGALKEAGIQTLSAPQDFVYDNGMFFDTIYHMNAKGRELRTGRMIETLRGALN